MKDLKECPSEGKQANEWVHLAIMGGEPLSRAKYLYPGYSESLDESSRMEKKIEEMGRGTWQRYLVALIQVGRGKYEIYNPPCYDEHEGYVALGVRATPYERVQAAWKVMNG